MMTLRLSEGVRDLFAKVGDQQCKNILANICVSTLMLRNSIASLGVKTGQVVVRVMILREALKLVSGLQVR